MEYNGKKLYEYTKKRNFIELDETARVFTAKMIMREVKQIAKEKNISEELAYELYSKGVYISSKTKCRTFYIFYKIFRIFIGNI